VVRATDYRGILMRVVVDARSGAIRDATRIVAGPGSYGPQIGMVPYEPLPNERPLPYGLPAGYDGPSGPLDDGEMLPPRPPAAHPASRASVMVLPPLPRPRPPALASRKSIDDTKPSAAKPAAVTDTKPDKPAADAKSPGKPEAKSEVTGSSPIATPPSAPLAASPAPQAPATAAARPAKLPEPPPIND
jgi:hypothetical protein